jgi:hypothetical protein
MQLMVDSCGGPVVIHEVGNLYCLLPAQLAMGAKALAAPADSVGAGPGCVIELVLQSSCRLCVEMPQLALQLDSVGVSGGWRLQAGRQAQAGVKDEAGAAQRSATQCVHP